MEKRRQGPRFSSLFTPASVLCRLGDMDRDKAIQALLQHLALENWFGGIQKTLSTVMDREAQDATLVGGEIAVVHARLAALDDLVVGVATSAEGFLYPDGQRVLAMFLFLVPKARPGIYLSALSALATACGDEGSARQLAGCLTPLEVWQFLDRDTARLPGYLRVRHIMEKPTFTLGENDTLERAIDFFAERGATELPVVDAAGTLVGVVTTRQLFRVCLPDYILWLEDMSPFLNFEPFAEVLRKESQTWLAEIMTTDHAVVDENDAAIFAAKEITRRGVDNAFVVRNEKLVGIVSLRGMLSRILRD